VGAGGFRLAVDAQGGWEARVEQQLDVPLAEPPTQAMTAPGRRVVSRSELYGVDKEATGTMTVYRERDGRLSLRLEDFYITPNVDLEFRLSAQARPRSTPQAATKPYRDVGFLKATAGSINHRLPAGTSLADVRSVVIWCEITRNAYAAAPLASRREVAG